MRQNKQITITIERQSSRKREMVIQSTPDETLLIELTVDGDETQSIELSEMQTEFIRDFLNTVIE